MWSSQQPSCLPGQFRCFQISDQIPNDNSWKCKYLEKHLEQDLDLNLDLNFKVFLRLSISQKKLKQAKCFNIVYTSESGKHLDKQTKKDFMSQIYFETDRAIMSQMEPWAQNTELHIKKQLKECGN